MGLFGKKNEFNIETLKKKAVQKEEFTKQEFKFFTKEVGTSPSAYALDQKYLDGSREKNKSTSDREKRFSAYSPTEKVGNLVHFDDINKVLKFQNGISLKPNSALAYEDIGDFEIIEDNNQVVKSGLSTAIGGGVLFGPAGAIAGAVIGKGKKGKEYVEKLQVILKMKNGQTKTISFISTKTKVKSLTYKTLEPQFRETVLKIESIIKQNVALSIETVSPTSSTDEIRKYKELLDDGILTQEEFDFKKKELLGI